MPFDFSRLNSQLYTTPSTSQHAPQPNPPVTEMEEEYSCAQPPLPVPPLGATEEETEMLQELFSIDPEKKLSIWALDTVDLSDSIVKQYVELVLKHNVPEIPTIEEITRFKDKTDPLLCSAKVQGDIIMLFTSYFQTAYFLKNVQEAVKRDITLFNPKVEFFIPGYINLPMFYFDQLYSQKRDMVLALQTSAARSALFAAERYLVLAIDMLARDLGESDKSKVRYELTVLFEVSRKNFKSSFKMKDINWDEKKGRVHGSLPKWRKVDNATPPQVKNKYAEKLASSVVLGKLKLSAATMNITTRNFFDSHTEVRVQQSQNTRNNNRNIQQNERMGAKEVRNQRNRRDHTRNYNPAFNRGRQLEKTNDNL